MINTCENLHVVLVEILSTFSSDIPSNFNFITFL